MYYLCIIFEVGSTVENSYPYREVLLTRSTLSSPFSFPVYNGEIDYKQGELAGIDPFLDNLRRIYEDSFEFVEINNDIIVFIVKNKPHSLFLESASPDYPQYISTIQNGKPVYAFAIMDEILQGRYCHVPIARVVRNLFFRSDLTDYRAVRPTIPYLYDSLPEKEVYPTDLALVSIAGAGAGAEAGAGIGDEAAAATGPASAAKKDYPLHNDKYIRIPFIGYHGTSQAFIERIFNPAEGLRPTLEKGMYGNNAYYFGNFWKAIRYAFRDSQYSTIDFNGPLNTDARPAGFIEVPNTAHRERDGDKNVVDIVRDVPALVRFVIFLRDSSYLPRELPKVEGGKIRFIREVPEVTGAGFLTYSREAGAGAGIKTFTDEYVASEVGKPLFSRDDTVDTLGDIDYLVPAQGSTRQEVALRLLRGIHIATTIQEKEDPKFAVIVLKMPGDLPDLTAFNLMTAGFLTDGNPIYGSSITHITEEKIRMMLVDFGEIIPGGGAATRMVISGAPTLDQTSHRLAMEDLTRLAPSDAHVLIEAYSLPPEVVEQIAQICISSGRKLILIRARNDLQAIPSPSQPMIHSKDEMIDIQNIIDINVANLEGLGGKVHTLTFTPNPGRLEGGTVRIKNRICDIAMEESIEVTKDGKRVFSRGSGKMGEEYVAEYPRSGGSMRVYPWAGGGGDDKFNLESILPARWKAGETESLIVEPFRIAAGKRAETEGFNITSHTEIITRLPNSFVPVSWHLGDLRSLTRHHVPLSVGGRVL